MRVGSTIVRCMLLVCFGFCAIGFAQSDSTLSPFGNDAPQSRVPFRLAQQGQGEKPGAVKKSPAVQKPAEKKPLPDVTNERINELMAFVREHHPEIRPLLKSLQKTRPSQYQATLKALDREVKSLQALKTRFPLRYKISLQHWITKSKITLLSAQLAIKKSLQEQQAIEKQIYALIQKQQDLRIEMVAADAKLLEQRLAKYKSDLAKLKENRKSEIERQMDVIKSNSQRIRLAQQKKEADAKQKAASPRKKPATGKPPVNKKDKSRMKNDKTNPKR